LAYRQVKQYSGNITENSNDFIDDGTISFSR